MARGLVRLGSSAITVAAAVVVSTGVAGTQSVAAAAAPSKGTPTAGVIAVEGPMTGEQASTGIDMANGAQLAVDQINAAGGIDGVRLTLLKLDDKATAAGGVAAAHQAIAAHAFAVVGPFNSSVGVANLSIYAKAGLPIVRLTSSVKTEGRGVTTQPMDSQVAPVELKEIAAVLHATRPAIVYDTSTYTSGIAKQMKAGLAKAGHPVVAMVPVTSTQTTYANAVGKAAAAHPGLLYIAAYGTEAGQIAKAASTADTGKCFVDLAAQGPDFVAAATQPVASNCLSSGVPSAEQFAGASQYVTAYQSMFHTTPGTWGTFTYDSVQVLANAVRKAGWHQKSVSSAMDHTRSYQGITGPITISPSTGNRVQSTVVILDVNGSGNYVIDPQWASATGFPLPSGS
ncbi:MAG TPA: branched-chain amino acid ABC transporter substrate-binding protein [Acidimicrobiales bacterium]|jgi:ABC-type branched-subunit amino acid transport system substrate-binding protein|nr:branched-chain amino acid ABC transporter substrate-binding protein [Acidimicrobiales bacterium]